MASPSGTWITTTEAAQRLGVKRATLYAYVSRGLLRSERRPGQQESLFDRAQIDAMASATRPPGSPQPVLRFRSIATSVSSQVDGDLLYRGRPLQDVVALGSLDDAAAVVLGTSVPQQISRPSQVGGVDLSLSRSNAGCRWRSSWSLPPTPSPPTPTPSRSGPGRCRRWGRP